MEIYNYFLFLLTVIPLIVTPGPDIILVISQALSHGKDAAIKAVVGILLGYMTHALLSALGIAAVIATSPLFFNVLKWLGVTYLVYLASLLMYGAAKPNRQRKIHVEQLAQLSFQRGFLTSFLNPKGLLMYLAILPQFIPEDSNTALQALTLSFLFVFSCGVIYIVLALTAARAHGHSPSNKMIRIMETVAGIVLISSAVNLAVKLTPN